MKLSQIQTLIAVAERGSLRAAARHMGIAQPAATRSIRELERSLGAQLLIRTPMGTQLTKAGKVFLQRASAIQHELERASIEVKRMAGLEAGAVTIGLSTVPHIAYLPKALPAFQRRYPDVRVHIIEGLFPEMESRLRASEIDFYIGPTAESRVQSDLAIETLHGNERLVFARPGHPLRDARRLSDLCDARWVSTSVTIEDSAELGPVFARAGLPPPSITASAHSSISMAMIAASTDLLALMPQQWVLFCNSTGLLEPIRIEDRIAGPDMCIVRRADLPLTEVAEHLSDLFRRASLNQPDIADPNAGIPLPNRAATEALAARR